MAKVRACLLMSGSVFLGGCMMVGVAGSGKVVTEPRTVSGFSNVSLSGSGQLLLEQNGTESLTVTTDDNLLPYIKTEVHGDTLELGMNDQMTNINPTDDVTFKLSVKNLDELRVSGSGRADLKGVSDDRLRVRISGSGGVVAHGTAGDLEVRISGSGDYRGDGLQTRHATVAVSGSGSALVSASDTVDANVSGSGSVEYVGDPQVTQHVSGSGSVHRR